MEIYLHINICRGWVIFEGHETEQIYVITQYKSSFTCTIDRTLKEKDKSSIILKRPLAVLTRVKLY